jgi:hypothetical protein
MVVSYPIQRDGRYAMMTPLQISHASSIVSWVLTLAVSTACSSGRRQPGCRGDVTVGVARGQANRARPARLELGPLLQVDWRVVQDGPAPVVRGRVYNDWGLAARDVRLLVEGVDANGRVLWQRVERLPGDLTPGTTAPFVVRVDQPAGLSRERVFVRLGAVGREREALSPTRRRSRSRTQPASCARQRTRCESFAWGI